MAEEKKFYKINGVWKPALFCRLNDKGKYHGRLTIYFPEGGVAAVFQYDNGKLLGVVEENDRESEYSILSHEITREKRKDK